LEFLSRYLLFKIYLFSNLVCAFLLGIHEVISSCKVGDATRSKLKRVAEWTVQTKCAPRESHHQVKYAKTVRFSLAGSLR
jgi:hypothetical protein